MPAPAPTLAPVGYSFADISVTAESPAVQRQPSLPVQRDDFQLTPPSLLQPPDPAVRYHLGGDMQLQLEPQVEALMQQLDPDVLRPLIARVNFVGLPETPHINPLASVPMPPPSPVEPPPPTTPNVSPKEDKPKNGSSSDIADAIKESSEFKRALGSFPRQDWYRIIAGGNFGIIRAVAVISLNRIVGEGIHPDVRKLLIDQLDGNMIPVPGLNWLALETNISGPNLIIGLHLDVGKLLPPSLNFGPLNKFDAIGEPPQPEPLPGQRRAADDATPSTDALLGERLRASAGRGTPLEPTTQQWLEGGLGADLVSVRLHTDSEADHLSRSLRATAFTTGADIFFHSGAYSPSTSDGQRLLAHEATHRAQARPPPAASPSATPATATSKPPSVARMRWCSAGLPIKSYPPHLNSLHKRCNISSHKFSDISLFSGIRQVS